MAEARRYSLTPELDIKQLLLEAQHRWLRPAEIYEILRNYKTFRIAPEPQNRPPSGSLFLFDRKVLRYFRKDGHNWRKKKDGKTVKEAHERLKAESVDVLHCYYAHGEENENFQRRSYWLLDEDYMHIVLVHYLEVKGNKGSLSRSSDAQSSNPVSPTSFTYHSPQRSQITDAESPNSTQTSEYEDAESDNCQRCSRYYPFPELQQYDDGPVMGAHHSHPYMQNNIPNNPYSFQVVGAAPQSGFRSVIKDDMTSVFNESDFGFTSSGSKAQFDLPSWSDSLEESTSASAYPSLAVGSSNEDITKQGVHSELYGIAVDISSAEANNEWQVSGAEFGLLEFPDIEASFSYPTLLKQKSLDFANKGEGLKKYDSFSKWMSSELGEVDESHMKSTQHLDWDAVESGNVLDNSGIAHQEQLDAFLIGPSLSQEQLFSIHDFSPNWSYSDTETEVRVSGTFLKGDKHIEDYKWSCMFGDVEVPAHLLTDSTLLSCAPPHKSGRAPFYITCSNRLACSEVREFEFRDRAVDFYGKIDQSNLHFRLDRLLSLEPTDQSKTLSSGSIEEPYLSTDIDSLIMECNVDDVWGNILKLTHSSEPFGEIDKNFPSDESLKAKLRTWLLHKRSDDGKGPTVLDKDGQGVLHLAAALGYDWALEPTINAGVLINFRDIRGWTALHWAASCGRERTVVLLATMGADPGAVTDPTPEFPSGRTAADLASSNGHKGIAGFLAEFSLVSHLSKLTLKGVEGAELSGVKGIEDVEDHNAIQLGSGHNQGGLALKDSLSAVRNAAQAAARIHQVFRVQSFQRKQMIEIASEKNALSDEDALSSISVKSAKSRQHLPAHAAATRIQNKFRGWKGRKEFLIIRQRIIKIQAHVRGHQVRKHYRNIVWSVGIVEKVILRWRRKGSGLRGFRREGLLQGPSMQTEPSRDDDDDLLKDGRKQTEAKLDKALARVKSMVQYPEARDQYRRLQTIVTEIQELKVMQEDSINESGEAADDNIVSHLEEFLDEDTFPSS